MSTAIGNRMIGSGVKLHSACGNGLGRTIASSLKFKFEILNSHGSDFANDGYFRIKSNYLLNSEMAFEFYTVQ